MERSNSKTWAATLTPHRSLSRQGFIAVMSLIAGANFIAGVVFYAIGAWPVIGFCGLDVLLMWWAFRVNFADGRKLERIEITAHELILERLAHGRERQEQRFVRRWVKVGKSKFIGTESFKKSVSIAFIWKRTPENWCMTPHPITVLWI